MKRTRLNPGKGFKPRTSRLRRGVLVRSSEKTREAAKAAKVRKPLVSKPKPVTAEERHARQVVRERSSGLCEVCGRAPMNNWHHRVNKGQGGPWSPENGLAVCGTGTTGCHGAITTSPALAYERGWSVRSTHNPAEQPVWLAGRGWSYLTADGSVVPAADKEAA